MPSIHQDPQSKIWQVHFRWNGEQYKRTSKTTQKRKAKAFADRVEVTLDLLRTGHLEMPNSVDPVPWILSHGKVVKERREPSRASAASRQFGNICDMYYADQLAKAESTLGCEKIHIGHLKRIIRSAKSIQSISIETMQSYANRRSREKWRGKPISGQTIHKEIATFRQVWKWARQRKLVRATCPIEDEFGQRIVNLPKVAEKEKFQTWRQIKSRISREGLEGDSAKRLWKSIFLDEKQVTELLKDVKKHANRPFIYPMFAFAAFTGARRSEIIRSEVEDFDFNQRLVLIREKKRRKDLASSSRFVPMNSKLMDIMQEWFEKHPGGMNSIVKCMSFDDQDVIPLTARIAHHAFKYTLCKTRWSVLSGFHVLRHSFGSNLARSGKVRSEVIGEWMGHSTEEMRKLYQHLFPQDGPALIDALGY